MAEVKHTSDFTMALPCLPNFIGITGLGGTRQCSVADLPDSALKELGAAWTSALLDHASKIRETKRKARV